MRSLDTLFSPADLSPDQRDLVTLISAAQKQHEELAARRDALDLRLRAPNLGGAEKNKLESAKQHLDRVIGRLRISCRGLMDDLFGSISEKNPEQRPNPNRQCGTRKERASEHHIHTDRS